MSPRIPDAYSGDGNMAEENRFDPARLERVERRLRVLEDAEAIRNLKARYAALCDSQYDANGSRCCSPKTRFGKAPAWAGSRGGSPTGTSSGEPRRSFHSRSITA